jgi:hypothetical protein
MYICVWLFSWFCLVLEIKLTTLSMLSVCSTLSYTPCSQIVFIHKCNKNKASGIQLLPVSKRAQYREGLAMTALGKVSSLA